ncbi:RagB/SusD family nutrient uptake outer membrane protein [Flavobacterium sp. RHBU_3]|uniref:RagB/SusD family nutrient uptake outer membrane protein n=1 Tax=Flavobacterium sp. RHBU_3 TaxID=3391184 RepID=UPI0039850227
MKNIIKVFGITSLLVLGSCTDDFITKSPYTQQVEENFYKTPEDGLKGLVAVYDILQREGYGGWLMNTEIASDNCYGGFGTADSNVDVERDRFQFVTDKEMNDPIWENDYIGIYRANVLLENLDNIEWGEDTALRTQYEAEAKFLRAFYHFRLARVFGDIVPLDHTLTAAEFESPRQSAEVTYKLIAEDLKFAADNLGDDNYSTPANANYGRVTKWAAEGLLAKAFLFYTTYYGQADLAGVVTKDQAITYVNDVVNNSGHALVDDFASLWLASSASEGATYAGEGNTEAVFAIRYNGSGNANWNLHDGNRFKVNISVRGGDFGPYGQGWGGGTVTPMLYNAYGAGDTRRDATIIDFVGEGLGYDADANGQRQYTGYGWKKGARIAGEQGTGDMQIDNTEDIYLLRFSDVLLMAAELNLGTNDTFAQTCLDRIRNRAYGVTDNSHSVPATLANIMNERRLELALEGERWFDLIRQGMTVTAAAVNATSQGGEFALTFRPETLGWFALPQSQVLVSNGAITQNAGW